MDAKTYIQQQTASMRSLVSDVTKDTTEDQFNWLPPGTLNPISAVLIHIVGGEDFFVQNILQGKPRVWETQAWGSQIGIQIPPSPGHDWDACRCTRLALAPVLGYAQAVQAATEAYLAGLTAEELDRPVNFVGRMVPVAQMLALLVAHAAGHAGEIAALKGMQGAKGLPF
jgi:hypothetical protein